MEFKGVMVIEDCYVQTGKTKATWKGMRNGKFPNQLIFEIGK